VQRVGARQPNDQSTLRGPEARARAILALALLFPLALGGCLADRFAGDWGSRSRFEGFEPGVTKDPGFDRLMQLSGIFYERITVRRFNSKATFDDPALREYFQTPVSFSDYYANFSEALSTASFESHRPTGVRLQRMVRKEYNQVNVHVVFRGENAKPLRWWMTRLKRVDHWEFIDGRWWIIPGKV
jgi:hypothetical protein